jgi:hypothetical protein
MKDVREFVEKMLVNAKDATTSESVLNFRAQAFGVIMFAQKFIPYDELQQYWEEDGGIWYKFNDIAREKSR